MTWIPERLREIDQLVERGDSPSMSVRELVNIFGNERRGRWVVRAIRKALGEVNLVTYPNFEYSWIDNQINFYRKGRLPSDIQAEDPSTETTAVLEENGIALDADKEVVNSGRKGDPAYRIGKLAAANHKPKTVKPDAEVSEAITIMLRNAYDQLPVMTTDRDVRGAITWKSIGARLALRAKCDFVRDCMVASVEVVSEDASLFRVITLVIEHDFVLVRNREKLIGGIVTAADLSETFYQLGRPFLLLGEIENHIRNLIDGKFSKEELNEVRTPGDTEHEIVDVSDLTFGGYVRLLQKPERWERLNLKIDRVTFVKDLERINDIRNDVMHFDPDGISSYALDELRKASRFLEDLQKIIQ